MKEKKSKINQSYFIAKRKQTIQNHRSKQKQKQKSNKIFKQKQEIINNLSSSSICLITPPIK
jgi:hypothetical protein